MESLARGLTVLTAFGEGRSALTLTDVAKATGLARATARRALITYEHLGLVTADAGGFTLTPRVLSLGYPPLSRTTLARLAAPRLRALADRLHEPTALAVRVPGAGPAEIQYVAVAAASRVLTVDITVGTRLPASRTALGRALLGLAEPGGYALADEELESGLRSIAVPVRDRTGRPVAALNVATHAARRTLAECVSEVLPALHATAAQVQDDLHIASRFTHVPLS